MAWLPSTLWLAALGHSAGFWAPACHQQRQWLGAFENPGSLLEQQHGRLGGGAGSVPSPSHCTCGKTLCNDVFRLLVRNYKRTSPSTVDNYPLDVSATPIHAYVLSTKKRTPLALAAGGEGGGAHPASCCSCLCWCFCPAQAQSRPFRVSAWPWRRSLSLFATSCADVAIAHALCDTSRCPVGSPTHVGHCSTP